MSLYETKAARVCTFHELAVKADIFDMMNPEKKALIVEFVDRHGKRETTTKAMADYYLKRAPLEAVFDRTHTLVGAVINIIHGWGASETKLTDIEAQAGALLVGDEESQDLQRLERFVQVFIGFFPVGALPPSLQKEALRKQIAEHEKARAQWPVLPPGLQLKESQAEQRELDALCTLAFQAYHDFLDGYFGRTGNEAYEKKAAFAYDRRAGSYRYSKGKKTTKGEADNGETKKADGANGTTGKETPTPAGSPPPPAATPAAEG